MDPSVLACCSHPGAQEASPFFSQPLEWGGGEPSSWASLNASRWKQAGVWRQLEDFFLRAVRVCSLWVCGCSCSFLFSVWVSSGCQLFFSGCIFASGCRSVQNEVTWLIIVWNRTFHIEVRMVHDDDDGTS